MNRRAVELGPVFHRTLARIVRRARHREGTGDRRGAAHDLRQAAEVARRMAEHAPRPAERIARRREAEGYLERAERLEEPVALTEAERPAAPGPGERPAAASGFSADELLTDARVEWSDVAGCAEAAASLRMAVALLLAPAPDGIRIGPPRAVLLHGPPGNGKTLLAAAASRTLARATDGRPAFLDVRLPRVLSKFFGESSRIVGEIYRTARARAPMVVFVDEIDALTRDRDGDESGPERRILATLLAELDGLAGKGDRPAILTIAATNRPWDLDPAVLSRFDRRILVGLPDRAARRRILELQMPHPELAEGATLDQLAERTTGYSGRDLEALVRSTVEAMIASANPDLDRLLESEPGTLRRRPLRIDRLTDGHFEAALAAVGERDGEGQMARYLDWSSR